MVEVLVGWWVVHRLRSDRDEYDGIGDTILLLSLPFLLVLASPVLVWEAARQRTLSRSAGTFWAAVYVGVLGLAWVEGTWWVALLLACAVGLTALLAVDRAARRERRREAEERSAEDYYYNDFS